MAGGTTTAVSNACTKQVMHEKLNASVVADAGSATLSTLGLHLSHVIVHLE